MKDDVVVKGIGFRHHQVVGDIVELATSYSDQGADELVFYDITASPDGRSVNPEWVSRTARQINIPFCVAGGIRDIAAAEAVLNHGADKISINTPALDNPDLIDELAKRFGTQCVVVGIDSYRDETGQYVVNKNTGDPSKAEKLTISTEQWIQQAQARGAGEIVLNCMNQDGVRDGYDNEQLSQMRALCKVPLIASGGAGSVQHFSEVFHQSDVSGALAASVFHSQELSVNDVKRHLLDNGIKARL